MFPNYGRINTITIYIYIYISGKIAGNFVWMFITSMFRVSTHQINIQMTIRANPNTTLSYQKENPRII